MPPNLWCKAFMQNNSTKSPIADTRRSAVKTNARRSLAVVLGAVLCATTGPAAAINLSEAPLFVVAPAQPIVMLNMSKDHQLYYKAYSDYADIDGDKVVDTTFKASINYYGYFDSRKCYDYDTTALRFVPKSVMASSVTTCETTGGGEWSGNFLNWASMARMDAVRKLLYGGHRSTDTATRTVLERVYLPNDAHSWAKFYGATAAERTELEKITPFTSTDVASGITLCNTTVTASSSAKSQTATDAPLIRVAKGNFALWAANERWQCRWSGEKAASNSNNAAMSGITAAANNPDRGNDGIGEKDYLARVEACVSASLVGTENCKQYPDGNLKPVGLLQQYGDTNTIHFGLFTGSYNKNISGGVLRKNAGPFTDEVNTTTDGTFKSAPTAGGIVNTLNRMRIYGYRHDVGSYLDSDGDSCTYQLTSITEGTCRSWGNPMSEIYLESLRYLAGKSATADFVANDSGLISGLTTATWKDPLDANNYCASLNIINFNASVSSYDDDQFAGTSDLGTTSTAAELTNTVGSKEGIAGDYFIGRNGTDNNELCTPKAIAALGSVSGICAEAPTVSGSYLMGGLAYFAHTNNIRPIKTLHANDTENKVNTYGIALASATPKISIPVPGKTTYVTILPAYRLNNAAPQGGGGLVDFKIVSQDLSAGTGKFYVNWEDSEQGGDYDQDMWGTIEYSINGTAGTISVTTDTIAESTSNPQGFGYIISGTTKDGAHFHSGIENFDYTDPTGVLGCVSCRLSDGPTTVTYDLGTSTAKSLEDPLYYAAKWGGFADADGNKDINTKTDWDARINSTGATGSDGIPDNYFFVTNPAGLERSLTSALNDILKGTGSAASVAVNAASIGTDNSLYQAIFQSGSWTGRLLAKAITVSGSTGAVTIADAATWDASEKLKTQTTRNIITRNNDLTTPAGVGFRWNAIGSTHQASLTAGSTVPNMGSDRLDYIRGTTTKEFPNGDFRQRDGGNVLGDIVHSAPEYVQKPPFNYPDGLEAASHATFKTTHSNRPGVVYVGANDGMLHGFWEKNGTSRVGGQEAIAYIPSMLVPKLPALTDQNYSHKYFVDSSPVAGDVFGAFGNRCTSGTSCWRTVLVGGLGAGGKGYFALDVTDPEKFLESNAADLSLWEFPENGAAPDADMGYSFSEVTIAKMHTTATSTRWGAVFGNGYGSTNGSAVLYVLNAVTGSLIAKIDTESGPGNGLSTPILVDVDADFIADYAYAGDLKGNMWKFDLKSETASAWRSFYGKTTGSTFTPAPLFKAVDSAGLPQPITSRPDVGAHPSTAKTYLVYFGTGKYFEVGDNAPTTSTPKNSFYGVWDKDIASNSTTPPVARAALLSQTISEHANKNRTVTDTPIDWNIHRGWYHDLPEAGEMDVNHADLRGGRVLYTTLTPSNESCSAGGKGWLMEVDYQNGGLLAFPPFDLNKDGAFTVADQGGSTNEMAGIRPVAGIPSAPTFITDNGRNREIKLFSGSTGEVGSTPNNPGSIGRRAWRQVR